MVLPTSLPEQTLYSYAYPMGLYQMVPDTLQVQFLFQIFNLIDMRSSLREETTQAWDEERLDISLVSESLRSKLQHQEISKLLPKFTLVLCRFQVI